MYRPSRAQESAQNGDLEGQLRVFLATSAKKLRDYVARRIPRDIQRQISVEDILQDVWTTAFQSCGRVKLAGPDALDRWLMTLAKRRLVDGIRTVRRLKRGGGQRLVEESTKRSESFLAIFDHVASWRQTPSRESSAREAELAVRFAVASLPGKHRRVIEMHYIEGRTRADIAQAMQTTISAINSLLYRARENLRDRLGSASRFFSDAGLPRRSARRAEEP